MRTFQELGHTAVFLIGDFTALVGDPTGQNESRPRLTRDEVNEAAGTYLQQAFKVLDGSRVQLRRNSEWLDAMTLSQVVDLMAKTTVSRMLERKDFRQRFEAERPIHQHEFLYPLLQAYDSVALENDVELGGTDQLFNLLMGRDLMAKYGKRPQIVMTTRILWGTDARLEGGAITGKKMSKSADNYIGLQEDPTSMYRKAMQIDDGVILGFFELLSPRSADEIAALKGELESGRNPMEIKSLFAREIVERFHGAPAAEQTAREFEQVYAKGALPDDVPTVQLASKEGVVELAWALKQAGLVPTTSEARRLIEQGGVEVDGQRAGDPRKPLERAREYLVRVGSKNRRFARIRVVG
jgi:tyrosyl-tRNA synthetase